MDLSQFKSELSFKNKATRLIWAVCWLILFLPSPRVCHGWRRLLLSCFGASIGKQVRIASSCKVYYPPNLTLMDHVVVGPHVDLYCVAPIVISQNSMISQYSYLCAASHDYSVANLPLIALPIEVGERSWICARAFVGPGVSIGSDVVVGACAVVVKNVDDKLVVGGNPAKTLKTRD